MQVYFDRFAILLSSICAVHCITLPILAGLIPLLDRVLYHGDHSHDFWFHQFILLIVVPVSILALFSGYRCHQNRVPVLFASAGLAVLVFTAIFADALISSHVMPYQGEAILTVFGGLLHATGHVFNVLASRKSHTSCVPGSIAK